VKKATKTALVVLVLLIATALPLYIVVRPQGTEFALQVKGNVGIPLNFTLKEFAALPKSTIEATLTSSSHVEEIGTYNFTGVVLWRLLELCRVSENASSVYVQAIDGYGASLSIQELKQNPQILLAYQKNSEDLKPRSAGGTGPIRLVIGFDEYAQRWVKNVGAVEVK
jgi:DMSO/TMAO reductase YedYZ molybdopterin-dependent catalytic subunit